MLFTAFPARCLAQGIMWKTSQQAPLLCPWARQFTGCLHLNVTGMWRVQAAYRCGRGPV